MNSINIATLNINGLSSTTRQSMLENFIPLHELDIVLLQEVTQQFTTHFSAYGIYYNIGTTLSGIAFVTRNTLRITNLFRLPPGRAMAAQLWEIYKVKIYVPSGTAKRKERENFFNNELPYILDMASTDILLGDDFNCMLDARDSTGHGSFSRSLNTLIHGYPMRDAWRARPGNITYTHFSIHGTTRLDRFYLTEGLLRRKTEIRITAAIFTDHFAVILRLSMGESLLRRGRGFWKLRSDTLTAQHVIENLKQHWAQWKKHQLLYPIINLWWIRHCKKRFRQTFQRLEAESRRDSQNLQKFIMNVYTPSYV
jgi:exonuclease III